MIVDPGQDVGEIGLRVEAVHLGGLDDGHRTGQRFGTGVRPCKEPVFPPDANRAQGALGWIVVDGDPTIRQEQAEGILAADPVTESLGQIPLAGDQGELALGPCEEGRDFRGAVRLARSKADVGGTTADLALDVIKRADAVERLTGDR